MQSTLQSTLQCLAITQASQARLWVLVFSVLPDNTQKHVDMLQCSCQTSGLYEVFNELEKTSAEIMWCKYDFQIVRCGSTNYVFASQHEIRCIYFAPARRD